MFFNPKRLAVMGTSILGVVDARGKELTTLGDALPTEAHRTTIQSHLSFYSLCHTIVKVAAGQRSVSEYEREIC